MGSSGAKFFAFSKSSAASANFYKDKNKYKLHFTYLKGFQTERSPEVRMGILWIALDDGSEIFNCLLVVVDHLVSFSTLVQVLYLLGQTLYASGVGPNCFLKFLLPTIGQPNQVVNIALIC